MMLRFHMRLETPSSPAAVTSALVLSVQRTTCYNRYFICVSFVFIWTVESLRKHNTTTLKHNNHNSYKTRWHWGLEGKLVFFLSHAFNTCGLYTFPLYLSYLNLQLQKKSLRGATLDSREDTCTLVHNGLLCGLANFECCGLHRRTVWPCVNYSTTLTFNFHHFTRGK